MKQKMEFSKKIYIANLIFVVFVVITSFICVVFSGAWGITDLSPITVICTACTGELAIHSAFHLNKSRAENVLKISKQIQKSKIETQVVELANQIMQNDGNNMM